MTAWRFSLEPLIDPDLFFGRRRIVEEIRDRMTAGPSPDFVFVHGGQKIGRTSLLKQLHARHGDLLGCDVRTCLVDLRLWSVMDHQAMIDHFAEALLHAVHGPDSERRRRAGPTLFEDMVQDLARPPGQQLILLIDRGDALIQPDLRRRVATLLGMLNDSLPNLGIVLCFGTAEQMSGHHMLQRMEQVEEAIREISPVWTRATTRILGALPRAESRRYLQAAGQLSKAETEWAIDLAGDHPFLLNRVGLTASRLKPGREAGQLTSERRAVLEDTLARELLPMGLAILQRLRSDRHGRDLEEFACELAALDSPEPRLLRPGTRDAMAVDILAGEGLVQVEDTAGEPVVHPQADLADEGRLSYSMPSRLFRRVLLTAREQDRPHGARRTAAPREPAARVEVVAQHDPRSVATVALTDIEQRILQCLLEAPGALLDAEELAGAVWGPPPDSRAAELWRERLRQRLIGLRRKLEPHVGGRPIVNVYGKGYRLTAPERFSLR